MTMRLLRPLLLAFALLAAPALAAEAPPKEKPNPLFPIQDDASFDAAAKTYRKIPYNEPALEFGITLPASWSVEQVPATEQASRQILGDIARFKSPFIATMQAQLTIQSVRLTREISAEDWLRQHLAENRCIIEGKVEPQGDRRAEASCTMSGNGDSLFITFAAAINSDDILLARFATPQSFKKHMAFLRKKVIDSFHFVLPTESTIEPPKDFVFPDAVRIAYPASWELNGQDTSDIAAMSTRFLNKDITGKTDGMIRVAVIKRGAGTSLKKETEAMRDYVSNVLGLDVKALVSSGTAQAPERFSFTRYEVYQAVPRKTGTADQQLRFAVLGDKEWYIFALGLSPTQEDDFSAWARDKQAFELILRRMK